MTKISKIITAASILGVMGLAVLPAAGYAAPGEKVGTADVTLQVNIAGTDSIDGGNNPTGYKWFISDRDGGTTNMTKTTGGNGGASGGAGFEMIAGPVAVGTGVTANNSYGFQAYYINKVGGGTVGGTLASESGSAQNYYGTGLLVGGGATPAASVVLATSTPIALSTSAAGTLELVVPALKTTDGVAGGAGGANSWFKYDSSMPSGLYENTLTITAFANL